MNMEIARERLHTRIDAAMARYPVTVVLGARQTGKTHLCRTLASSAEHYFDLEHTIDAIRLSESATTVLGDLRGVVVIDEAQELPSIFKTLRVLADRPGIPARFVVTGSVAPSLLESISESLAGRAAILEMGGFDLSEAGMDQWPSLWLHGGHPPSYLNDDDAAAYEWRENYLSALIGRDLRIWSHADLPPTQIRKLLDLIADGNGQAWNHSAAATILGVSYKTIQSYVETLKGAYLIRELQPIESNVRKRIRRSPVLLLRDSGILHNLLRIVNRAHLETHPRRGFSWESFCTEQIVRLAQLRENQCYRYNVQGGAETDLVVELPGRRIGFEFKCNEAPRLASSMRIGREDLVLDQLYVIFPGDRRYGMEEKIEAVGSARLIELCDEFG